MEMVTPLTGEGMRLAAEVGDGFPPRPVTPILTFPRRGGRDKRGAERCGVDRAWGVGVRFYVSLIGPLQPRPAKTAASDPAAVPAKRPRRLLGIGADTFESLGIPDFRWLWASSLASFTAMNMQMVARVWLVLELTDDSPLAVSLVTISFALPVMFVSVIGGALADRIPRRGLIILGQSANVLVTLAIATLDMTDLVAFWHLMVAGVINGSLMALNMPSRQALVSEIVPDDRLMNGIALQNSAMNATRIAGPAAAGFLILFIDTWGVFYLVAAIYGASVLSVVPMRVGRGGEQQVGPWDDGRREGRVRVRYRRPCPAEPHPDGVHPGAVRLLVLRADARLGA